MPAFTDEDRLEEIEVMVLRRNKNDVIIDASKVADKEIVLNRTPLLGAGIKIKPIRPGGSNSEEKKSIEPETVTLDEERRQKLISFIEGNGYIPKTAKKKINLTLLNSLKNFSLRLKFFTVFFVGALCAALDDPSLSSFPELTASKAGPTIFDVSTNH